jgi:hypothetical protein
MGLCRICALCAADVGSTPMRGSRTPRAKMVPKTQNAHRDAVVINDPTSQHSTYSQCPLRRQHHRAPHPLCLHSHVCTRSPPAPPPPRACAARMEDASRPDATRISARILGQRFHAFSAKRIMGTWVPTLFSACFEWHESDSMV